VLMNKYDSYTYDETNQEYEKNDDYSFHRILNTLSFHLKRRKEQEERGISIPLFLKRDSAQ
jgi:hypothetical protein